jgi:hypothetical protein
MDRRKFVSYSLAAAGSAAIAGRLWADQGSIPDFPERFSLGHCHIRLSGRRRVE